MFVNSVLKLEKVTFICKIW